MPNNFPILTKKKVKIGGEKKWGSSDRHGTNVLGVTGFEQNIECMHWLKLIFETKFIARYERLIKVSRFLTHIII